jgi:hypothetical protein
MNPPVYVLPPALTVHTPPEPPANEIADLLRQTIALQQEQLAVLKALQQGQQVLLANQDGNARWRAFLARWDTEFPGIGPACKQSVPAVERAYLTMIRDVTEKLADDPEAFEDEFVLAEFLDRYGMRLSQLGNLLGQIAPLADAAPPPPEKG